MSELTPEMPITEALGELREELKSKIEDNPGCVTALDPREIRRKVAVFQPRSLDGRLIEDDAHVQTLVEAIGDPRKPKLLDPLLVWWSGKHWYVIDGFHRLLAYRRAGVEALVPVQVFFGNLDEAVEAAAAANSKDKLPMTKEDKVNMAWRLTLFFEGRSKRQVAEACAVAERTVATMRKVKKELLERGRKLEEISENWDEARRLWQNQQLTKDIDRDAARRKKAERWAKAMSKTFGRSIFKDPEAFALALKIADGRLPVWLMDSYEWSDDLGELLESRGISREDPDEDY